MRLHHAPRTKHAHPSSNGRAAKSHPPSNSHLAPSKDAAPDAPSPEPKQTAPTSGNANVEDAPAATDRPLAQAAPVQRELAKVTGKPVPGVRVARSSEHKKWLAGYAAAALVACGLYAALGLDALDFLGPKMLAVAARLIPAGFFCTLVLVVSKGAGMLLLSKIEDRASRFNMERVRGLLTGVAVVAVAVTNLLADWRTTVTSLGLVSLILGFALQTPITSFIGWIYILVRQPYRVGDRIQIGEAKGDVIDVNYLDTTLWECGGPFLSSDHPSGRVVKIPNRAVLDATVFNYSWPLFPYIWNEVHVQVGYQADLKFVAKTMRDAATDEMGEEMIERVSKYKALLAKTPVDEVQVKEEPAVLFRVDPNTWIQATVRYLVLPRHAGSTRSKLTQTILARLNAAPEKSLLPRADAR